MTVAHRKTRRRQTGTVLPRRHRTEDDDARLHHHDVGRLAIEALWAEERLLQHELAWRILRRKRPHIHDVDNRGDLVLDWPWLVTRIAKLRDERLRRRRERARG